MPKWSRLHGSLSVRIPLRASMAILKSLEQHRKFLWWGIPESLVDGREFWLSRVEPTGRPAGMDIDVLAIAFCDIFFVEEFEQLKDGLQKLSNSCGERLRRNDLHAWFQQARTSSFGGSSIRLGYFFIGQLKPRRPSSLAHNAFLCLKHLAPSVVALTWLVTPSSTFTKRFHAIIDKDAYPDATLILTRHGFSVASISNPVFARQKEIDSLFLSLNQEVVSISRTYLRAGMSIHGPLASVEALAINEPLDFFPANSEEVKDEPKLRKEFWGGLGFQRFITPIYAGDDFRIYPVNRGRNSHSISYQSILSLTDFATRQKRDTDIRHELRHRHLYFLDEFCPVLALIHFHRVIQKELLDSRMYVTPSLREQTHGIAPALSMESGVARLASLSGLHFQQLRVTEELSDKHGKDWLFGELRGINRRERGGKISGELVSDLLWQLDSLREFNTSQLELLRSSFRTLLEYKNVLTNHRVSVWLIVLTVLLLLLTSVLFIPEAERASILRFALKSLGWNTE
jgi:hypothetical protein